MKWSSSNLTEEYAAGILAIAELRKKLEDYPDHASATDPGSASHSCERRPRLFHGILPAPECCGFQMPAIGNLSLHTLVFQCIKCFRQLCVKAEFEEDFK